MTGFSVFFVGPKSIMSRGMEGSWGPLTIDHSFLSISRAE